MDALIGYMIALALSLLSVAQFYQWQSVGLANVQTAAAASQQVIVNKAAAQYVQDNALTFVAQASANAPVTVPLSALINAHYLPAGFAQSNVFGQIWQLQVLQPTNGQLEAIVESTQGRPVADPVQLVQIAAQTGAQGGFVPYAGQNGDATVTPNNAYGAYGAWTVPLTTGFTNPGSGHLVSLLAFSGVQANNSYLYRVQVPNHPELNSMQTDLGLTDTSGTKHNITGAATVTADTFQSSGGGQLNADQGGSLELGGNNTKAGAGNPYVDFHLGGQGVQDFNARVINDSDSHLTIDGANGQGSLTVQGTLQLGNVATAGSFCPKNGVGAANIDGSGQWLTCQYNQMLPIGGRWLRQAYWPVTDGSVVPAPTCPAGGTPAMQVTGSNFTVDSSAGVNFAPFSGPATGPWTINFTDGSGTHESWQGIASTYCVY